MTDQLARLTSALADRYAIQEELGAGGMATVYLAEDLKHHRKVAVKVLRPELAAIIGAERFLKEIEVTANLQHPHILPLHDSGEADSFLYYVMPYVEGESLRDKLNREKQLPIEDALRITEQVGAALGYAHRHDVIHRDIKPENVLLHDEQALVADFGIALAVTAAGGARLTETGLSLGTPHYMSPEQATAERELDGRSDVYSLGVVLYEMLVGDPPFGGSTAQVIVGKILSEPVPSMRVTRATVPESVQAAVERALAKMPADRFATVGDFVGALAEPHSTPSTKPVMMAGTDMSVWRRRALGAFAVGALLLLIVIGQWLVPLRVIPKSLEVFAVELPESHQVRTWLSFFALSPDGLHVAYRATSGELTIRSLDQLAPRGLGVSTQPLAFSPQGDWIAYRNFGQVFKISVAGGTPTELVRGLDRNGGRYGLTWGADGYIYFPDYNTGLFRVPASGGDREVVTTIDSAAGEGSHRFPSVLPNGRGVLYTSWWTDSARIMVHSLDGGGDTRIALGTSPRFVDGLVLFGDLAGTLHVLRFDQKNLTPNGVPASVESNVQVGVTARVAYDVTPAGDRLLYWRHWDRKDVPVLVDRAGREQPLLADSGAYIHAVISPDGDRIAVLHTGPGGNEIWVHTLDGSAQWRVTAPQTDRNQQPVWSPDGQQLAFASPRDGGNFTVYRRSVSGSGEAVQILQRSRNELPFRWDKNGLITIWSTTPRDSLRGIWAVSADKSTPVRKLTGECDPPCNFGDVSPNGRFVTFSDAGASWVATLADPLNTRQQLTVGYGPTRWSHNGREIFYFADGWLTSALIETEPELRVGAHTRLFDWSAQFPDYSARIPNYVDPLGRGFVFVKLDQRPRPPPVMVVNFREGLREKLGND